MTLREYILFWQETYDKHQSRPTTYAAHNYVFMYLRTISSPAWEIYHSLN